MTDNQTSFARLIEALEKDYMDRNEGDVRYSVAIDRRRGDVCILVSDTPATYCRVRYRHDSGPLSNSNSIPKAVADCCERLIEKVGKG